MRNFKIKNIPAFLLIGFFCIACSQSDAQREFEREAFSVPNGIITETTADGSIIEDGSVDPNDWRVGPDYRGLIRIDPAYPNPVLIDDFIFIELDLGFENRIRGLRIFAFRDPDIDLQPVEVITRELNTFETLRIPPSLFAGSTGVGLTNLYRIVITDQNSNVISYGDVEVQR